MPLVEIDPEDLIYLCETALKVEKLQTAAKRLHTHIIGQLTLGMAIPMADGKMMVPPKPMTDALKEQLEALRRFMAE